MPTIDHLPFDRAKPIARALAVSHVRGNDPLVLAELALHLDDLEDRNLRTAVLMTLAGLTGKLAVENAHDFSKSVPVNVEDHAVSLIEMLTKN